MRFTKELLRINAARSGGWTATSPGSIAIPAARCSNTIPDVGHIGPYTATFYDYVRRELGFESDLPYEVLNFKANEQWSFAQHENRYVEVAETLRKALAINPHLKVFVANGYYDLATPYFATEYTFNHLSLDPSCNRTSRWAITKPGT